MSPQVRSLDLDTLTLLKGGHHGSTSEFCLLEAASYMAGHTKVTDTPPCVSPILGAFGRSLNDVLPDDKRQHLKPYIPALLDTADDGHDQARGLMAADWLIRVYTPTWLRLAGLTAGAAAWAAAGDAAWDHLKPTVDTLQDSAIELYGRMITPDATP